MKKIHTRLTAVVVGAVSLALAAPTADASAAPAPAAVVAPAAAAERAATTCSDINRLVITSGTRFSAASAEVARLKAKVVKLKKVVKKTKGKAAKKRAKKRLVKARRALTSARGQYVARSNDVAAARAAKRVCDAMAQGAPAETIGTLVDELVGALGLSDLLDSLGVVELLNSLGVPDLVATLGLDTVIGTITDLLGITGGTSGGSNPLTGGLGLDSILDLLGIGGLLG